MSNKLWQNWSKLGKYGVFLRTKHKLFLKVSKIAHSTTQTYQIRA